MRKAAVLLAGMTAAVWAVSATAMDITILTSDDPLNTWRTVSYPNGEKATYTVGIGSGAYRHPADPADIIYTVSDRGPNFTCKAAKKLMGAESQDLCKDIKGARFYPTPDYTPSIYRVVLDRTAGAFTIKDVIALKTASGRPISGLLNPQKAAKTDVAIDVAGNKLAYDSNTVDAEGIVKLSDGSFWIGEEMGPSILHVLADGRIVERFVPSDAAEDYKGADMRISAILPAILSKRQANRGIESMAVSPDEAFLYFMVQNPLANPDAGRLQAGPQHPAVQVRPGQGRTGRRIRLSAGYSRNLRFRQDQGPERPPHIGSHRHRRRPVCWSWNGPTRQRNCKKFPWDGATNILGGKWDDAATAPSLELSNVLPAEVKPVSKTLRFDTFVDAKEAPVKLEGVAVLGDGSLALVNDNDFGIGGETTRVVIVEGAVEVDPGLYRK